ncbi:hypothetical protein [Marispirochaeta sp.]|uniref:hypothetical protein n=1 Tax=Marispirochaeta sp. TaxID=2038653 RepID=UPI0029C961F4|nr:hypothetical protein [Marispirochaeta sp.]
MKTWLLYIALLTGILGGCSAAPPRIDGVSWEVFRLRSSETGNVREELSLFIRGDDDDGRADLEELYIVHPESRLYWRLYPETWEERSRGGVSWIGSSWLSGTAGVPRGEYLLVLLDRAGERSEERIFIDLPSFQDYDAEEEYPALLRREKDFLIIASSPRPYYILGEDTEGQVRVSTETDQESFNPLEYTEALGGMFVNWYVFVRDSRGWYAGSGPYSDFR